MSRSSYRSSPWNISMSSLILLLLVATQSMSAWVGDYASNHGCGETVATELCDPDDAAANRACRDACHYSGCRGGACVDLDSGDAMAARGCHCMP